jgi:hypothetical protein
MQKQDAGPEKKEENKGNDEKPITNDEFFKSLRKSQKEYRKNNPDLYSKKVKIAKRIAK